MTMKKNVLALLFIIALSACVSREEEIQKRVAETQTAISSMTQNAPTATTTSLPPTSTPPAQTASVIQEATATLSPEAWETMPIIPVGVSEKMCQVYKLGQMMGNNPRAFSKVGDCQSTLPSFLGYIEEGKYNLGEYEDLQTVIDFFEGSFGRSSLATKNGLTASGVMAPLWNDWKECGVSESPLDCEYRIHQPSFAIISLGTNDANGLVPFETTLRRVIDTTIGNGVVPILVTKADNTEGDHSINQTIIRLAYEYEIPVWNFWLVVQPLFDHGLKSPEHLTEGEDFSPADFSKPYYMKFAFNVRNLNALQVLQVMMNSCKDVVATPTP